MAFNLDPFTKSLQDVVNAVRQLIEGRGNFIGDVTLTPGATATSVSFINCSKDCRVFLSPQTVAARVVGWNIEPSDIVQGGFLINHTVAPAGASFSFACIGG